MIVLGEGQGTFLQVCIAKKTCEKHWGRPAREQAARPQEDAEAVEARQQQEAAWAKQREEREQWRNELRARAVRLIAERTATVTWSPMLLRLLLEDIQPDELFLEVIGKAERLPVKRYATGRRGGARAAPQLAARRPPALQQAARREGDVQGPRRHVDRHGHGR